MTHWIKLYTETLNDPKIGLLSYQLRWRFTEALLLAGSLVPPGEVGDGSLPSPRDAAYMAHVDQDELLNDWHELERAGLLAETPEGWLVVNYTKRQSPSEGAERVRLHRERKQLLQKRYSNVSSNTPDTESESDTDTDTDTELIKIDSGDRFAEVKELVEKHTGLPAQPKDVPALQELAAIDDLQEQDITGAIAWFKSNGRVAYGAAHLINSIKHNRAMRIQAGARASPSNGRPKRTGALARERARLAAEEAAKNGNTDADT